MLFWFLSCLRRFSFCLRIGSSLFSVSMNTREVATCPHWSSASFLVDSFLPLCHVCILSPPWKSNGFRTHLECGLISRRFYFFPLSAISTVWSRLLQIQRHTHVECGWHNDGFPLTSTATCRSLSLIALLPPKPLTVQGHPDQYRQFSRARVPPFSFRAFPFFACSSLAPNATECLRLFHFSPVFHQNRLLFLIWCSQGLFWPPV